MLRVLRWLGMVFGAVLLSTGIANAQAAVCPCTIFGNTTPTVASAADPNPVELGVRFQATSPGFITGLRFYKGAANTGTHVGSLWTNTGTQLATATFTAETSTGWQQVTLASPVAIAANTTYVASYFAPNGGYAVDTNYFTTDIVNGPLKALANGTDGPNGAFRYGSPGGFPTNSFNSSNYWVDVVFQPAQAPAITSVNNTTFTAGSAGSFTVTATGFPPPTLSVSGTLPAGVSFDPATGVLSGTPAAGSGGSYPLTFTAANGVSPDAVQSFTLTVSQAPAITSADNTTFTTGSAGSFTVTATGFPPPTLSVSGTLPAGVSFDPATGVLSGTPAAGSGGSYPLTFTATNGVSPDAVQSFTLTVTTPTAVALTSSNNPSALGEAVTLTATVSSPSGPPTGGTVQFKDGTTDLGTPVPLSGGTASLTTASLGVGTHSITAVYSGSGTFGPSTSPSLNQVVSATLPCTRTYSGDVGPLTLGPGRWCITNARVTGLTIGSGASVTITNSQIVGPVTSTGAISFRMCGSSVSRGLTVSGSTGYVLIGDVASGCARNDVSGGLTLQGNSAGVHVADDRVSGSLTFNDNSGTGPLPGDIAPLLSANQISANLACAGNTPAPTNNRRPNTVIGTRSGQCSNPGF